MLPSNAIVSVPAAAPFYLSPEQQEQILRKVREKPKDYVAPRVGREYQSALPEWRPAQLQQRQQSGTGKSSNDVSSSSSVSGTKRSYAGAFEGSSSSTAISGSSSSQSDYVRSLATSTTRPVSGVVLQAMPPPVKPHEAVKSKECYFAALADAESCLHGRPRDEKQKAIVDSFLEEVSYEKPARLIAIYLEASRFITFFVSFAPATCLFPSSFSSASLLFEAD
jgi:hypothetical protein